MSEPARAPSLTSAQIRIALARHYAHPTYGIVFEVAQGTGMRAHRHLDAMAMGLWPSRGLVLIGIEVKVSVADFRTELRNPAKAEELARFCDLFYIAAPAAMLPVTEMPPNWGLLEVSRALKIQERLPAHRQLAPAPINRDLLAAVFRAASRPGSVDENDAIIAERKAQLDRDFADRVKSAAASRATADTHDAEQWRKVKNSIDMTAWHEPGLVNAIKLVHRAGIAGSYGGLRTIIGSLQAALDRLKPLEAELLEPKEKML